MPFNAEEQRETTEPGTEARNRFQLFLMERMLKKAPTDEEALEWIDRYAKIVSDIMDNPEEKEVRDAIHRMDYEKAAGLILERPEFSVREKT